MTSPHSGGVAPRGGVGGACLRDSHVTDWTADDLKNEKMENAPHFNCTVYCLCITIYGNLYPTSCIYK